MKDYEVKCPCCGTQFRRLSFAVFAGTWERVTLAQGYGRTNQRTCRKCKRTFTIHVRSDQDRNVTKLTWRCEEKL